MKPLFNGILSLWTFFFFFFLFFFPFPFSFLQHKTTTAYDKDNIPEKVIARVDPYIVNPDFTPENVKKASTACEAICMWVRAMHKYHFVARAVEPKRQALAAASAELAETMKILNSAKARLKQVMDKLDGLEKSFNEAVSKKKQLAKDVEQCTIRLNSAMKLISGLGGEEKRWKDSVIVLNQKGELESVESEEAHCVCVCV